MWARVTRDGRGGERDGGEGEENGRVEQETRAEKAEKQRGGGDRNDLPRGVWSAGGRSHEILWMVVRWSSCRKLCLSQRRRGQREEAESRKGSRARNTGSCGRKS